MYKNYYLVNVPGKHGYSFMIKEESGLRDDEVIGLAVDNSLFDSDEDADYCTISEVDDHDYLFFKNEIIDLTY